MDHEDDIISVFECMSRVETDDYNFSHLPKLEAEIWLAAAKRTLEKLKPIFKPHPLCLSYCDPYRAQLMISTGQGKIRTFTIWIFDERAVK